MRDVFSKAAFGAVALLIIGGGILSAADPVKTYPLAATSLVLDVTAAGGTMVAVADRGFILRSTDDAVTWQQQASPVETMLTGVLMRDPNVGWAVGHDAVILSTTDGGVTWTQKYKDEELETPLFDIWFENDSRGLAVGAYGLILETTDGGATWEERRISEDEPHLYTITPAAGGALFAVGEMGSIFKSADKGMTWASMPSPYEGTLFGALALKDGGILVHGLRGHLYRSDDGGNTWAEIAANTEASLLGGAQRADGSVVIVGLSGTVLTAPDGRGFTAATLADREALGGAVETSSGKLLVFGEKGAYPLPGVKQ